PRGSPKMGVSSRGRACQLTTANRPPDLRTLWTSPASRALSETPWKVLARNTWSTGCCTTFATLYASASTKEQFGAAQTGQKNKAIKNPTPAKIAAMRIASTIRSNAHDPGSISAPPRGRDASCICHAISPARVKDGIAGADHFLARCAYLHLTNGF